MKNRIYITILSSAVLFVGYVVYSGKSSTFVIKDLFEQKTFRLSKYTDSKPANIDLVIHGQADSTFAIKVIGLPAKSTLFDSIFNRREIDFKCRIDYYKGNGAEIIYIPKGAVTGNVTIEATINSDF